MQRNCATSGRMEGETALYFVMESCDFCISEETVKLNVWSDFIMQVSIIKTLCIFPAKIGLVHQTMI